MKKFIALLLLLPLLAWGQYHAHRRADFRPFAFGKPALWLDANGARGLNDGDPITVWLDISGNGHIAEQPDPAKWPLYTNHLAAANNNAIVWFTGGTNSMGVTNLPLQSYCTVLWAGRGELTKAILIEHGLDWANNPGFLVGNGTIGFRRGTTTNSHAMPANYVHGKWVIGTFTYDGNLKVRTNSVEVAPSSEAGSDVGDSLVTTNLWLQMRAGTFAGSVTGATCRVWILNKALADDQLRLLRAKRQSTAQVFLMRILLLWWLSALMASGALAPINGVLKPNAANPRYFTNLNGAVYLTGTHTWNNGTTFSAYNPWTNSTYLHLLTTNNLNFIRLWTWPEQLWFNHGTCPGERITPCAWDRPGPGTALDGLPDVDLDTFNQTFFDDLRSKCTNSANSNIYVGIMLACASRILSADHFTNWVFNPGNNSEAWTSGLTSNDVYTLADANVVNVWSNYVKKVVDTVNDLDNVLYEVINECPTNSVPWQEFIIDLVHSYEAGKPKQHPIGITALLAIGDAPTQDADNAYLYNADADWTSLSLTTIWTNAVPVNHTNVSILDTDHNWSGHLWCSLTYPWKTFARGHHVIQMERLSRLGSSPFAEGHASNPDFCRNMGICKGYADRLPMVSMMPSNSLANSGYCLAHTAGDYYWIYQSTNAANIVITPAVANAFEFEWRNAGTSLPSTRTGITNLPASASTLTPPPDCTADTVLLLRKTVARPFVVGL